MVPIYFNTLYGIFTISVKEIITQEALNLNLQLVLSFEIMFYRFQSLFRPGSTTWLRNHNTHLLLKIMVVLCLAWLSLHPKHLQSSQCYLAKQPKHLQSSRRYLVKQPKYPQQSSQRYLAKQPKYLSPSGDTASAT